MIERRRNTAEAARYRRQPLFNDIAQRLKSGQVLIFSDLEKIRENYGFARLSQFAGHARTGRFTQQTGVEVGMINYKGTYIYFHPSPELGEDVIEQAKRRVDAQARKGGRRSKRK